MSESTPPDSKEMQYSQRLLFFYATTLKSLDRPAHLTIDCQEILTDAARIAIKDMCDWCRIDLRFDFGKSVYAHKDASLEPLLGELRKTDCSTKDEFFNPMRVIRSGMPMLREDSREDLSRLLTADPKVYALMQKLGFQSYICVPIKKGEDTIGSLIFVRRNSSFDDIDLVMAEEFALKVGVSIERVLLYKNLAEMRNLADAANRAKTNFLANVSHEIRTPLGAILGFSELLVSSNSTQEDRNDWGNKIRRNSGQLLRIVDDILDLSKVEAGKLDVEVRKIDLKNLLEELLFFSLRKANMKNIKLDFLIEEPLPRFIYSDETRLSQILSNIIGNAIKFTSEGEVKVRIGRVVPKNIISPELSLFFEVSDTGMGVATEQTSLLFRPFSQADNSHTRQFGGTGLGLALSRNLAQCLGGDLILKESSPGRGSKFLVTINAGAVSYMQAFQELRTSEPVMSDISAEEDSSEALKDVRILLVEDSTDIQALVKRLLEVAGAQISIAENGEEGVRAAMTNPYDVVLMDVQMPVKDGCQAVQELRVLGYKGLVIALTANAMKEEQDRCLAAGFNAHLSKPMRRQELIQNILRIRKDHQLKRI